MTATLRKSIVQERETITYVNAELTADLTVKLFKVPSGQRLRVDAVQYINPTGLAKDATNFMNIKVIKGAATVIANWSTETDEEDDIAADTFVDLVMTATDADRVVVGGEASDADLVQVFFDEGGAVTLPAGRIVIKGRYVY